MRLTKVELACILIYRYVEGLRRGPVSQLLDVRLTLLRGTWIRIYANILKTTTHPCASTLFFFAFFPSTKSQQHVEDSVSMGAVVFSSNPQ